MTDITEIQLHSFWSNVDIGPPSECWNWLGAKDKGYGKITLWDAAVQRKRTVGAHQMALLAARAERPDSPNDHALHSCDNRGCVNPSHLRWGSNKDNMRERDERNKAAYTGEACSNAKLTEQQVIAIRASRETSFALAEQYSVTPQHITRLKRDLTIWPHLSEGVKAA